MAVDGTPSHSLQKKMAIEEGGREEGGREGGREEGGRKKEGNERTQKSKMRKQFEKSKWNMVTTQSALFYHACSVREKK